MLIQPHFVDVVALPSWCFSMTYSFLQKFLGACCAYAGRRKQLFYLLAGSDSENLAMFPQSQVVGVVEEGSLASHQA